MAPEDLDRLEHMIEHGFGRLHERHDALDERMRSMETKVAVFDDRWNSLRTNGRVSGGVTGGMAAALVVATEYAWRKLLGGS